ncbi:MAG TPA: TetR/AcrR family transcriptional regulator [Ktedonobacteraceae bacterium]|nr:TetR/AcrR family transcriptional regulator [Ktedonobacteraceae bacterium]
MTQKKVEEHSRPEGQSAKDAIRVAAVQLFSEYGYHAAPLRDIARIAGIQAASIYYHYANKEALLVEIMETYMLLLNTSTERILREQAQPLSCLHEAIANHIRLHTTYKAEFFIIDTELRALDGENRAHILSLRDQYEALLQQILRDGMEQGVFRRSDVKVSSYAIIAMCTEVATWFHPDGRLTVQQVIDMYSSMITQGLLVVHAPLQKPEESAHT